MKSSTAQMNDRKRAAGLRSTQQWVVDVRNTPLEAEFNSKLKDLRDQIDGLSEHYESKKSKLSSTIKGE